VKVSWVVSQVKLLLLKETSTRKAVFMARKPLESLGAMVRTHRGERKLRETAGEIGISAATLMRVENGRIPDVETFGKLCRWLKVDPGTFLGFAQKQPTDTDRLPVLTLSAHFKADQTPQPETVQALATMLLLAAKSQPRSPETLPNGGA